MTNTKYTKPPLSFAAQADQLIRRGLVANKDELVAKLRSVSYYRLSAYWYALRLPGSEQFPAGTTLDAVWNRYEFDRQLRLLVMDGIEWVEVAIRTQLVNRHTLKHGAFGYTKPSSLPGIPCEEHVALLEKIQSEANKNREDFLVHFQTKYAGEEYLPLWMASELMSFGSTCTLFKGVGGDIKRAIAVEYGVTEEVLGSWLVALNHLRNTCAHNARLWNRVLDFQPKIPPKRENPKWHIPVRVTNDRLFGVLTILHFLLRLMAPQSAWRQRLLGLLAKYPDVSIVTMGFPANWQVSPLWEPAKAAQKSTAGAGAPP